MNIKIFTLKFSPVLEGFDDETLRRFISDKNVIEIRDHFFFKDHEPYWAVMVLYNPEIQDAERPNGPGSSRPKSKKDAFRDILTDQAVPLFNRLKEWRRARAMKDSAPPYVVFNNRQLALIAVKAPESLNRLAEVEGVGKAKLEKYGSEVLAIIREKPAHAEPDRPPPEKNGEQNSKASSEDAGSKQEDRNEP